MTEIRVQLDGEEFEALQQLADRELRTVEAQARYVLRQALGLDEGDRLRLPSGRPLVRTAMGSAQGG